MRIKTQFLISITAFTVILVIIGSSVALTQLQITQLNNQEATAHNIQTGASNLNYISNNYFLYQSNSSIDLWQTEFSTLSAELAQLNSTTQQKTLINTVNDDLVNLNSVFGGVTTFLNNAPRNESIRVLPSFQTQWNRMAVQIQSLSFDSQQLSQSIRDQANQAIFANTELTIVLMSLFAVFFIVTYLLNYRRTLKSLSELKNGLGIIGSGNLDHNIKAGSKDEISDISSAVNQMATNLKTITASKTDLELEIEEHKKAEAQITQQLQMLDLANVIVKNMKDEIIFWNSGAQKMYGLSKKEAIGKIPRELLKTKFPKPFEQIKEELLLTGKWEGELVHTTSDGSELFVASHWVLQRDLDNNPVAIIETNNDITERKKAEEALRQTSAYLDNLLNYANAPIIVWDIESKITLFNHAFERLTGLKCGEVVGNQLSILFPENQKEEALEHINRTVEGEFWKDVEIPIQGKNGMVNILLWNSSNIYDEGGERIVATIAQGNDITERKKAELNLKRRTEELENTQVKLEENAVLLEEYSSQMEELAEQRANQLKDAQRLAAIGATAGMVGHDIRNPLQAITSDLYLAKTELTDLPDSDQKKNAVESLDEIQNNVDYINKIVADLQDYARPLNPRAQETNIKSILNDIVTKNGIPKNINLTMEVEDKAEKVMADPDYLKRIFSNLTLNAVQAMPNGGKLTIHAFTEKQTNDILIIVRDTGVGIPEAVKSKLFTPMMTTKSKGQGFGLAVVKRMTEGLGGTVTFESQEGKGTAFTVRLPSKK